MAPNTKTTTTVLEPIAPLEIEQLMADNAEHDGRELARLVHALAEHSARLTATSVRAKTLGAQRIPACYGNAALAIEALSRHGLYQLRLHRIEHEGK